jgi:hypothetical protein
MKMNLTHKTALGLLLAVTMSSAQDATTDPLTVQDNGCGPVGKFLDEAGACIGK